MPLMAALNGEFLIQIIAKSLSENLAGFGDYKKRAGVDLAYDTA